MSKRKAARTGGVILAVITTMLAAIVATPSGVSAGGYDQVWSAPKAQIQQDGPMLEVVVPAKGRSIDRLAYRLISLDTGAVVEGETDPPQIKLVLAFDESYRFSFRARDAWRGWSDWSEPVHLTAPAIDAYPFSIEAIGIDGGIAITWADTDADAYRINVRRNGHTVAKATVTGTETTIDGLTNGHTYNVTIRSIYGSRKTARSPGLPVTPNDGAAVVPERRDFVTAPLTGPTELAVPVAIAGATERIERVRVRIVPNGLSGTTRTARFDPAATATTGIDGAWVTRPRTVEPLDHELITVIKGETVDGQRGVLASSLQTWLLGNVDDFAPGASDFTRVGTWR
ncbi:MAG: fibronectin type III domain-containing protein [Actinomycetota bacterium]